MSYFPFESLIRRQVRKLRALAGDAGLIGYINQDNAVQPIQGDKFGPYIHPMGRASSDGLTGAVSVANGEPQLFLLDELGRLFVRTTSAGSGAAISTSTALENNRVVKATPGSISDVRMLVTTGIAAPRWLMIFNAIAAPANGATPVWRALLLNPGGAEAELSDSFIESLELSTGIVVAISTTELTYTAPAGAEALFSVAYQ